MSRPLAPVALFAYARPDHLRRTLDGLRANPEARRTPLFVYSDGARGLDDAPRVQQVRALAASIEGFASVTSVLRERNQGLAASIIGGVTDVLAAHGRAIVVEDDLLVSPHFLRYMNDGLDAYADEPRVASIHGYCYPTAAALPDTFFLRGADCWGWATWQRAWSHFNADGAALLAQLRRRGLEREFDLGGDAPFSRMLAQQVAGRNNSWAVRWHASCFLDDLLTLYPGRSLVHNIGNDGSGTHSRDNSDYAQQLAQSPVAVRPQPLEPSEQARAAFAHFMRHGRGGWWRRAARAVRDRLAVLR